MEKRKKSYLNANKSTLQSLDNQQILGELNERSQITVKSYQGLAYKSVQHVLFAYCRISLTFGACENPNMILQIASSFNVMVRCR